MNELSKTADCRQAPQLNGNISSRIFPEGRYDYTYDAYNRMTGASYTDTSSKGRNYSSSYNYGNDSRISSLLRTGITDRVGTTDIYGEHSNIYYRYTGSKLTWVANGGVGTDYEGRTGLPMRDPWDWNMGYDANGNLSYDESHNITNVSYNHLNQPTSICFADGSEIDNRYTSAGTKWESIYTLPDGTQSVTKYLGNAVVRDGKLDMLRTPWGYIDGDGKAHYYVTDYQGNVTHTVNGGAEIEQSVYYYPDGEPWVEPTGKNPYLFGGKERISFAGLRQYDFGARMLNSTVGTWWQVDPMVEKYYPMNPYSPMGANPVMYTDPTGAVIRTSDFEGHFMDFNYDEEAKKWAFKYENGETYSGNNPFVMALSGALNSLIKGGETGATLVQGIVNSENICQIYPGKESVADKRGIGIRWNKDGASVPTIKNSNPNATIDLGHELAHIESYWAGTEFPVWDIIRNTNNVLEEVSTADIYSTHIENKLRVEQNLPLRTCYSTDYLNINLILPIIDKKGNSLYYDKSGNTQLKKLSKSQIPYNYYK